MFPEKETENSVNLEILLDRREYSDALKLLLKFRQNSADNKFETDHKIIYCMIKTGMDKEALSLIRKNIKFGYFFDLDGIVFDKLRKYDEFNTLEKINHKLIKRENENTLPKNNIFLPENYGKKLSYPAIIILHDEGINGNLYKVQKQWPFKDYIKNGFVVSYFQSSQISCSDCYSWMNDLKKANDDIKTLYYELLEDYLINENEIFLAGIGGGADAALYTAIKSSVFFKGIILQNPSYFDIPVFNSLEIEKIKKTSFLLLQNEKADERDIEFQNEILKLLEANSIKCQKICNEEIRISVPSDIVKKTLKSGLFGI